MGGFLESGICAETLTAKPKSNEAAVIVVTKSFRRLRMSK
jgi:hypothetical protein